MVWTEITELVIQAQNGDRSAYGRLVERFQPTVYALALARLRNPAEAQELAQEVFLHAMTRLGQLRDPQCFAGWLRQVTVRLAINRVTRRGPVQGVETEVLEQTPAVTNSPLDGLVRDEAAEAVWKGLDRLKAQDRATLVAFYIHGQSLRQMSREFETPIGTIKRRLHVARNRLRRQMEAGVGGGPRARRREAELACV